MQPINLADVTTIPLRQRENKVALDRFAKPPQAGCSFAEFAASLPGIFTGNDLRQVVQAVVSAHASQRPVIWAMGAHVTKCGLNPIVIDLMHRGVITGIVLNGSGAIHDVELALIGETSEDVAAGLKDGTFGMVRETAEVMNEATNRVKQSPESGLGALLGEHLASIAAPNRQHSILASAHALQVPVTVHVAIGTDIVHMHPSADGAAIGQATFNDFRLLCAMLAELSGGVYMNVGSAVVLPEVFLKAFTVAQNLGANLHGFVTVNMDMLTQYRPTENVVRRLAPLGRGAYSLIGRHEIMVPLVAQCVVEQLAEVKTESTNGHSDDSELSASNGKPERNGHAVGLAASKR
jgi:deoxyhypusine synthase